MFCKINLSQAKVSNRIEELHLCFEVGVVTIIFGIETVKFDQTEPQDIDLFFWKIFTWTKAFYLYLDL